MLSHDPPSYMLLEDHRSLIESLFFQLAVSYSPGDGLLHCECISKGRRDMTCAEDIPEITSRRLDLHRPQ